MLNIYKTTIVCFCLIATISCYSQERYYSLGNTKLTAEELNSLSIIFQNNWSGKIGKIESENQRIMLVSLRIKQINIYRKDEYTDNKFILEESVSVNREGRVTKDELTQDYYGEWEHYVKSEYDYDIYGKLIERRDYVISGSKPYKVELDQVYQYNNDFIELSNVNNKKYIYNEDSLLIEEYELIESNFKNKPKSYQKIAEEYNGNVSDENKKNRTLFLYDDLKRLIKRICFIEGKILDAMYEYSYDNQSRLIEYKSFSASDGKYFYIARYNYDDKNRIITVECPVDEYSEGGQPDVRNYTYGENGLLSCEKAFWKSGDLKYERKIIYEFYP